MKSKIRLLPLMLALLLWTALPTACDSGDDADDRDFDDDGDDGGGGDDDGDDGGGGDDDGGDDDGDHTPPDQPFVEPPTNPYALDTIDLHGWAEPEATLDIIGGKRPYQGAVPEDGFFCALVDLHYDEDRTIENVLTVTATDDADNVSEPLYIHVFVDPDLTPQYRNVAPQGEASASSVNGTEGACGYYDCEAHRAADGSFESMWMNATSAPEGSGWDIAPQWIRVDLGENHYLSGCKVTWGGMWPAEYRLYYTDSMNPTDPHVSLADYAEFGHDTSGNGAQRNFPAGDALARNLAIVMERGATVNPSTERPYYQIKEFAIMGLPWNEYLPEPACP